jgi:hypothetical protein
VFVGLNVEILPSLHDINEIAKQKSPMLERIEKHLVGRPNFL